MVNGQNNPAPRAFRHNGQLGCMDWSGEIQNNGRAPAGIATGTAPSTQDMSSAGAGVSAPQSGNLQMRHGLPVEAVEAPLTSGEAYMGSMKAALSRNKGNYVVATFLIGTQNTTSWEGILYEVGNDYIVIYQGSQNRYIVCDFYSLKYVQFYDVEQQQALCERILREQQRNALG